MKFSLHSFDPSRFFSMSTRMAFWNKSNRHLRRPRVLGRMLVALLACSTVHVLGCGQSPIDLSGLQGEVTIDGSSTVGPISIAAATGFRETYPNVDVTVGISGTGSGFQRFSKGETDISDASRPIKPDEFDACRRNGIRFIELPVAFDGLTIVVHPDSEVEELTIEQLQRIFRSDVASRTWHDVNPAWPDKEIVLFAPGTQSGTFDYFKEIIVPPDAPENLSIRDDMFTNEDDNQLVTGVAGNRYAIGFFGVAYYVENRDVLKAVRIVNPQTGQGVFPSSDKIESGEYAPFSRPLFIYINARSMKSPEVRTFVEYYLENAGQLARAKGYVALPQAVYERAAEQLKQGFTGTHFLNQAGQPQTGPVTDLYRDDRRLDF